MRRPLAILLGAAAICAAIFAGSYYVAQRVSARRAANPADDLDWLRQEFHLSATEMARIRQLHDGYLPQCGRLCQRIADKKLEIQDALAGSTNVTSEAERKLHELGDLRAQCQTQMFRHFAEVSREMPADEGRRYLAEMQRVVLGSHETIEQSMSASPGHDHGNH